ncbi:MULTISPECIES: phage tail protein [Pseudomonas]|uniref:Putative phage tail protein n=1 Tax=Pseudomonas fluorescens (strain Q2-87) TaxID=1038922 RepID=J2Y2U3_PSEFQ|nr:MULTISPECIES: phage tail protein [Pseudomonas]EJL01471.1 putative phage tail protein [Pseudomonas fluorescens Q2-87]
MADYYTLLTDAGIAYETACKAAGTPIKLSQISVGDGGGAIYNPAATATALKREVWRGPLNALFQDEKNPSWLLAEVTIPPEVGGWYVREAGIWTDSGILYAIVKYPESFKPVLATSGSGKEFYIRSIFETSNAESVTLLIDDTVVKATQAWVASYVADELAKLDRKQSVRVATTASIALSGAQAIDGVAVVAGDRVLVKSQTLAKDNGIYVAANGAWVRAKDADASVEVTSGLMVSVEEGTTLANTIWQLTTDGGIVLGITALTFQNITQGLAPLNSPVLVNPTANTPPLFDNTKSIATTEYVMRASGNYRGFTSLTATTTLTTSAVGTLVTTIGSFSITLPPVNSLSAGGAIHFRNIGSGIVTIVCVDADNINSGAGQIKSIDLQVGATLELTGNGASAWWAGGTAQLQYSRVFGSTAAQFDSSLRLVNAAFAKRMGVEYSVFVPLTASSALGASSIGGIISAISPTPISITLPSTAGVAEGATIEVVATGSGAVTVLASGGDVLASPVATGITVILGMGDNAEFVKVSTTWRLRGGSIALKYAASFAALFGSAGYQKLPDGLVLQWGVGITSTGGAATIALPITFPTAVLKVLVSASGTNSVPTVGVVANNSIGINCFNGSTGAGKSENVQFLAIGY